jgi:hypothetical protein
MKLQVSHKPYNSRDIANFYPANRFVAEESGDFLTTERHFFKEALSAIGIIYFILYKFHFHIKMANQSCSYWGKFYGNRKLSYVKPTQCTQFGRRPWLGHLAARYLFKGVH